jgi:hypothetical protein
MKIRTSLVAISVLLVLYTAAHQRRRRVWSDGEDALEAVGTPWTAGRRIP